MGGRDQVGGEQRMGRGDEVGPGFDMKYPGSWEGGSWVGEH